MHNHNQHFFSIYKVLQQIKNKFDAFVKGREGLNQKQKNELPRFCPTNPSTVFLHDNIFNVQYEYERLTWWKWIKLNYTDWTKIMSCWNVDRHKVDWHVLGHVYRVWLLGDGHVDLVDTWRTRVVVVVGLMLVIVCGRQLNLNKKYFWGIQTILTHYPMLLISIFTATVWTPGLEYDVDCGAL